MAQLSKQDIKDIADLAQIALTDEEIMQNEKDLASVLAYFEKLQELDTDTVEEMGHITGMTNVYRKDEPVQASDEDLARIMDNVPDSQDGYIKVRSVL